MAERTVSVHLKADVARYVTALRGAGQETERFADRIERSTGRAAQNVASKRQEFAKAGERLGDGVADGYGRRVQQVERHTERVARRSSRRFRAIASAVIAGLPAASTAAIGLLTAGGAAAFIGLGAVALRENERIKASYKGLGQQVKTELAADAQVMEGAFVDAAGQMHRSFQSLRPLLRQVFAASAPHIETLIGGLTDFSRNAMPGMITALERGEPVMQGFREFLSDTGQGVGDLFEEMSEHSDTTGVALENLGSLFRTLLSGMGSGLGTLSDLWAEHGDEVVAVLERLFDVIGGLSSGALPVLSSALGTALDVLSGVLAVLEPISGALGGAIGLWLSLSAAIKGITAVQGLLAGFSGQMTAFGMSMQSAEGRARGLKVGLAGVALGLVALNSAGRDAPADMDALSLGLDRFGKTGKLSGETARLLGGDIEELGGHLLNAADTGLTRFLAEAAEVPGAMIGFTPVGESAEKVKQLDSALAQMVKSGNAAGAAAVTERLVAAAEAEGSSRQRVIDALPGYAAAQETVASATGRSAVAQEQLNARIEAAASRFDEAKKSVEMYAEAQRAATDPVFALKKALDKVGEAQTDYNKAVKKYGRDSPEAAAAAFDLAEAVSKSEQAALDGELSFDAFKAKLDQWVRNGKITRAQADSIARGVKAAKREADRFDGSYRARLQAAIDRASLVNANNQLNNVARTRQAIVRVHAIAGSNPSIGALMKSHGGRIDGPGTETSDSVPVMASRGEHMLTAAEVRGLGGHERVEEMRAAARSGRSLRESVVERETRVVGASTAGAVIGGPGGGTTVINKHVTVNLPNYLGPREEMFRAIRHAVRTEGEQVILGSAR